MRPAPLRSPRSRALATALFAAVAGSLLSATGASAGIFAPESGAGSPNADKVRTLYLLIVVLALIVFVAVEGALIWSMIKFRARKGRKAAQIHGNTRLEVGWTVGAAVILIFITAVTFVQLNGIKNPPRSDIDANGQPYAASGDVLFASTDQPEPPKGDALRIRVDGQQYVWRFQYPGPKQVYAYVDMVVPVGRTVVLDITADDVNHSWWIPALGGKQDAVPGYVNHAWFKARKPGVYDGQCAELCGRNHANMIARVRAVPFDEYQAWYAAKAGQIQAARDGGAQQRKQLQESQRKAAQAAVKPGQ